jgi:homoserine kinase
MPPSVTVNVPATSANLGPGFDCLGLALDIWGAITITLEGGRGDRDPMATMALTAARRVYEKIGGRVPAMSARYKGEIPIARGLGASAVARVGGALAANSLAGDKLDDDALLAIGTVLEGHADNVAPAIFGGMQVAVSDGDRILHTSVAVPRGLSAVVFVPELRMPTKESRKLLPQSLSRADVVYNSSRAALLIAAMSAGRFDLLDAATHDRLHQPARSQLFPAMFAIFDAARAAGAHCAYLSGGGSTICALASDNLKGIADAMEQAAHNRETPGRSIVTKPTARGAQVVEKR